MREYIFVVANHDQKVIFEHELRGQISDGLWENARPHDHYRNWCEATVKVGDKIGRNFYAYRKYDFLSRELLSVVGSRMILQVKIARAFGEENVELLEHLFEIFDESRKWKGLPEPDGANGYFTKIRHRLIQFAGAERLTFDSIRSRIENVPYSRAQLKTDLQQLKVAQNTRLEN